MRNALLALPLAFALTVVAAAGRASAGTTCRPNVFGGEDCTSDDGRARTTSRPNVFGGRDVTLPDGKRITCRPNVFGGEDCR